MALTKLGDYINISDIRNKDNSLSADDVVGLSTQKEVITTKADLEGVSLSSYKLMTPNSFAYVPDTSRRGDKMSLAYNNTKNTYLVSSISIVFAVSRPDLLLSDYLFMYFNRPEFDRYSRYNSWGSARETFSWDDMCDIELSLPPLSVQQKYVDIYNAMVANQQCYERGLSDLKLACDAYMDALKHSREPVPIGTFIIKTDKRNTEKKSLPFKGLSMDNYFINSIANDIGLDFSKYKMVFPEEFTCVLMKVGRDCRLTIAHNISDETYLVSPAYFTFRLIGIDASYFMAYVSRTEFERRGWFSCDTSARGSLSWEEFCLLTIPKASENEQHTVKNLYKAYTIRQQLNEQLKAQIKSLCPILIKGSLDEASA